jgi:acyl-coenzyme A thioesterase PaaI-like protein
MEPVPLDPLVFGPDQACFGCGPHNARGMQLRFAVDGDEVVTTWTPTAGLEGPPGILHGGLQATLADEVGAWTLVGKLQRFGFTTSLQLRYLRPARIGVPVEGRGRITAHDGPRVSVAVKLTQEGKTLLSGRIAYVIPTVEVAEKVLGQALPEAWHHLARPA